ncbi:MAG: sulfatase-like hydrolase/transferase [Terriglobus sp.]
MPMNRRQFLGSLAAAATVVSTHSLLAAASSRRPNIVVILADDVGYGDLSCYGATSVHTPHLDSLAANGRRFTNAHADAATCTPSRYAMLTGEYAWRHDGVQILPGDAKLLIDPRRATIPSVLKSAGYHTGLVGKWHIGLGNGTIDWNGEIRPGPREVGFDEAFFFPATADRVPTVFVEDRRVVGLDAKDPIHVSYTHKIGDEPTGKEHPELLKMGLSEGHDGTIVDGISRIGWMTGGTSARWKDEEIAATFTHKAVEFIERNQAKPFLLYFTPSDIHVPRSPAKQFVGETTCGVRCDVISQLDWSVGEILATLKRLHLENDTLVVFTSDNGPVVNDGYDDGADHALGAHKPAGPWRGGKYSIQEGGTRVPLLVQWDGTVKPGTSDALISQVDLLASFAALATSSVPAGSALDSKNLLPLLLGRSNKGRDSLMEEADVLAIVEGQWKLVDRSQRPGNRPLPPALQPVSEDDARVHWAQKVYPIAPLELYNLKNDPYELDNVAKEHPEMVERLRTKLNSIRRRATKF